MNKAVLLIGPICSGKTTLAKKLTEDGFIKRSRNYYSIDDNRINFGNNLMSGEFFAWANFLQQIENPPTNDNSIFEFSGTGRNAISVSKAINTSKVNYKTDWLVVYCLAPNNVLLERATGREYNIPLPYTFGNVEQSINFMNEELKKTWLSDREWDFSKKIKINMSAQSVEEVSQLIRDHFNK